MSNPPILFDPIGRIRKLLNRPEPRILLALVGIPGSGKSTFAARLAEQVNREFGSAAMIAVGMDGFHLTKAELNKMPDPAAAFARRGSPWTFNPSEMASLLVSVRGAAGITDITWPDFQHGTGDPVPDVHLIRPNVKILLVEGLYLLYREHGWDKVSGQFDESWFLNTPMEVSMDRLVRRHMATSGQSIEIAENRIASNDRLNAEIVARTRSYSNFMLEDVQKPLNST